MSHRVLAFLYGFLPAWVGGLSAVAWHGKTWGAVLTPDSVIPLFIVTVTAVGSGVATVVHYLKIPINGQPPKA